MYSIYKRSSLHSQFWMRLFLWISNTVYYCDCTKRLGMTNEAKVLKQRSDFLPSSHACTIHLSFTSKIVVNHFCILKWKTQWGKNPHLFQKFTCSRLHISRISHFQNTFFQKPIFFYNNHIFKISFCHKNHISEPHF